MSKHCTIKLRDGSKEAELSMDYQPENELIIIDGVFKFFGIEVEYEEVASKQLAIQKMYEEYYGSPENFRNHAGSAEQAEYGEEENFQETLKRVQQAKAEETNNSTTLLNPGIRERKGNLTYRCNYRCPKCGNSGNHYIIKEQTSINCHNCGYQMKVQKVNLDFTPDQYYNYFLAGLRRKKEN